MLCSRGHVLGLALGAFKLEHDLLRRLGLLAEDRLRLTAEALLLGVVPARDFSYVTTKHSRTEMRGLTNGAARTCQRTDACPELSHLPCPSCTA